VVLFLGGIMGEQYTIAERMKQLRNITGFNRAEFARQQGIPLRTIEEWEAGRRKMPEYVLRLLAYKIQLESSKKDQRIHIIQDENNKSIVLINDIRFKSRRNIDWNEIEEYLKEYIGNTYEILETCEKIYIGNDFPDEFCHSKDKIRLKGANEKAKAKKGWYRYDTRFGIPKYDENGELEGYHIYSAAFRHVFSYSLILLLSGFSTFPAVCDILLDLFIQINIKFLHEL
jgi:DNA-binding transcriptional regulator YiaG